MWRPEGWKKTGLLDEMINRWDYELGFEAGADAMLKALRKQGVPVNDVQSQDKMAKACTFALDQSIINSGHKKGHVVFIPDD